MSEDVTLPDGAGIVDTFQRARASDGQTVNMQAIVPVDPATGDPLQLAQQATLVALANAVATLNVAAAAIQTAVEGLNGKTTAVNTASISGTVALDGATLSALEFIQANTGLSQPLTDAQLRASALPLMSGAATEATLAALKSAIDSLNGKTTTVDTGAIAGTVALDAPTLAALEIIQANTGLSQPLTDAQLRATPVQIAGSISAASDFTAAVLRALELFSEGPHLDPASGRLRVMLDPLGGAQTLGTVSTLTTLSQIAGIPANSMVYDAIDVAWAQCVRGRVQ